VHQHSGHQNVLVRAAGVVDPGLGTVIFLPAQENFKISGHFSGHKTTQKVPLKVI